MGIFCHSFTETKRIYAANRIVSAEHIQIHSPANPDRILGQPPSGGGIVPAGAEVVEAGRPGILAALEEVAVAREGGDGDGGFEDVAPGVIDEMSDERARCVHETVDGVLVVGEGVVGRAARADGEEVIDARAPDVGADNGAGFVEVGDALVAVVDVADRAFGSRGGGATAKRVPGVGLGKHTIGGYGDELVLGVPRKRAGKRLARRARPTGDVRHAARDVVFVGAAGEGGEAVAEAERVVDRARGGVRLAETVVMFSLCLASSACLQIGTILFPFF